MKHEKINFLARMAAAGFLLAFFYLLVIAPFRLLEIPEYKFQDLFFRARHFLFGYHNPILEELCLVIVDDESLQKIGEKWPFKRQTYAALINGLTKENPQLIGLDFVFSGRAEPVGDFLLAQAMEDSGRVILASFVDDKGNCVLPLEEFRKSAKGVGIVNKLLDKDFCVRKNQLLFYDPEGKIGGWPWELILAKEKIGFNLANLGMDGGQAFLKGEQAEGRNFFFPVSGKNAVLKINYRFTLEDIASIPVSRALAGEFDGKVEGKIVLMGTTSKAIHDDYNTPLGIMSGLVINANVLVNLLTGDYLREIPQTVTALILALFVFLACFAGLRCGVFRGLLILTGITGGILGVGFFLFLKNWIGNYFTPLAAGWLFFVATAFYRYFRTLIENVRLRGEVVTDPLTGLFNRRFLESRIDSELELMASARRERKTDPTREVSVLMTDVDNFKKINDTFGHQFGDDVLRTVSFCLKECTRREDIVARYGGEEFCVILNHTTKDAAVQIGEKIRKSVESKEFNYVNQMTRFTISIGVAAAREDQLFNSRALLRAADKALYHAKHTGKNKVCVYEKSLESE